MNENETVRDVCANCEVFDAYERFKSEKDAEIARLNDALFAYAGGHVITGSERYLKEKNRQLEAEVARLNEALKPVIEVNLNDGGTTPTSDAICAVAHAQRVIREGGEK